MKILARILIVTFMLLVAVVGLFKVSKSRDFQFFGGIISRVTTDQKVVALTFDDGPTKENTEPVLDTLDKLGVRATFFVIGAELEENLEEGKKVVLAGHELGNHTYSHNRMVLKSPSYIRKEIDKTDELIRQAGFDGEIHFRPPFGKKLFYLPYYLKKQNRKTIMWDLEPESYPEIASSSNKITNHVVKNVQPGSIILLHVMYDSRKESLKSIEGIVNSLKSQGYRFVTVSELLKYK